jgi:hypothetical protein
MISFTTLHRDALHATASAQNARNVALFTRIGASRILHKACAHSDRE